MTKESDMIKQFLGEASKRVSCDGCGVICPLGSMWAYRKRFDNVVAIYQFCRDCILKQPNRLN